jgi:homoserine kinase type II
VHSLQLLDEIATILGRQLNIKIHNYTPIYRGYLNEKWLLDTNKGALFVKSYHPDRYRKHLHGIWQEFDQALRLQMVYHQAGGVCPELFANEEDDGYLFQTPSGRKFVVMEYRPGEIVPAGKVNEMQMYSLGLAASKMHNIWNTAAEETMEPRWKPNRTELLDMWNQRWEDTMTSPPMVRVALKLQAEILEQVDFEQFDDAVPGWTHLDLWVDNLLFMPDRLSAIVDFDRIRYSFPILDVGRAILSCTLDEGTFRKDFASAFAEGYRKYWPLPKGSILNAVRFSWITESFWWLRPTMEAYSIAPKRFAQEMIWTAEQWNALEAVLGDI